MIDHALRPLLRAGQRCMRSDWQMYAWGMALLCLTGVPASAEVTHATFAEPTQRYGHGILGDATEYGALRLKDNTGRTILIRLPQDQVFEDIIPRLADVDGDGAPEVIVIQTDVALGAALAVYGMQGKIAQTPHIGRTHRWLAPIGVADLDGDGRIELSYIDRPHLAKILRIWRFEAGALTHVLDVPGLTNHRIGWDYIPGGIRTCAGRPEMITADAGWTTVIATQFDGKKASSKSLGPYSSNSIQSAMTCK